MKVTITEADIREALPRFMPICTPRLMEEALVEIRRAALKRSLDAAHERVSVLAQECCRAAGALSGRNRDDYIGRERHAAYDRVSEQRFRAEERAEKLFEALQATWVVSP